MTAYIDYLKMTKKQSESVFQEYLGERGPALERLRQALTAGGQNPDALLDGSIDSLVPLWRWILSRLTGPDAPGRLLLRKADNPARIPRGPGCLGDSKGSPACTDCAAA